MRRIAVDYAILGRDTLAEYKNLYSNYYLSPTQLFSMVHLCEAIVHFDGQGSSTPDTVRFCLESLGEAKVNYPLAGPLQYMFRQSLAEHKIPVSDDIEQLLGTSSRLDPEDLLNACTRPTYKQPMALILPNMEKGLGQDFVNEWRSKARTVERPQGTRFQAILSGKPKRVEIGSILNP